MTPDKVGTSEIKVRDYSKFGNINEYLISLIGDKFKDYRRIWNDVSNLKKECSFPLFLVFETMFRCNLKCLMCIHSADDKGRYFYNSILSLEVYRKIMKEASTHYCPSLTIGGSSEPLLDNRVMEMIRLAKSYGFIDIMLNTNATLLDLATSEKLIDSGLTRLRIGFDGASPETYEKIRVGSNFSKVKQNILNFIDLKKKKRKKLPIVRVSCVSLNENSSEIDEFINFWKEKADYVSIQTYKPHVFTDERLALGDRAVFKDKNVICSQPFERLYIRGNGDVHPCCSMVYGPLMGNVYKDSLYDIWNSHRMKCLRRAIVDRDWNEFPSCRECVNSCYSVKG